MIDAEAVWEDASVCNHQYEVALGDGFTPATAYRRDATALVGAAVHSSEIEAVETERFGTNAG